MLVIWSKSPKIEYAYNQVPMFSLGQDILLEIQQYYSYKKNLVERHIGGDSPLRNVTWFWEH